MEDDDFLAELARCVPRLEEPCGIPSAPALLQLSRFAAEHVKVVLAGQGADEPHTKPDGQVATLQYVRHFGSVGDLAHIG